MISVEVSNQDSHVTPEADRLGQNLSLHTLTAIHQDNLSFALERNPRQTPFFRGDGGTCPEECDREFDRTYLLLRMVIVLVRSL